MDVVTKYGVIYNVHQVTHYKTGEIKSIRLGKDTILSFRTKAGKISAREVISFYKTGEIKSLEPVYGTRVKTFIGVVNTYNPSPNTNIEEESSLQLTKAGEVISLRMIETGIALIAKDGSRRNIVPEAVLQEDGTSFTGIIPLKVTFLRDSLQVTDSYGVTEQFSYREYQVQNFTCNKRTCNKKTQLNIK